MYANIKCHVCYQHYLRHPYEDELAVIEAESFSGQILMSKLTCMTEKEPEQEIKNKGDEFCWKKTMKIFLAFLSAPLAPKTLFPFPFKRLPRRLFYTEKMRNTSGH